jgi:hypothetical protein
MTHSITTPEQRLRHAFLLLQKKSVNKNRAEFSRWEDQEWFLVVSGKGSKLGWEIGERRKYLTESISWVSNATMWQECHFMCSNQLSLTSAAIRSDTRRKNTAVSEAIIVFVTSESTEKGVSIKFCAELDKTGRLPYIKIKTDTMFCSQAVWFQPLCVLRACLSAVTRSIKQKWWSDNRSA